MERVLRCGFEVFTMMAMKNIIFLDVTPCGSCNSIRFRGTCRLYHQGGEISELGTALEEWLDDLGKFKKGSNLIEFRTRDLPACTLAPQPTTLLRARNFISTVYYFIKKPIQIK
jgi:hypothetical protein